LVGLSGIGSAHHFHRKNVDPVKQNRVCDDFETPSIGWPNFHSGRNGNVQALEVVGPAHPLLRHDDSPQGEVAWLPAHPHEGSVGVPAGEPNATVIARGHSLVSGRSFNLIVACDTRDARWIAESSFHHFADYNWAPSSGAPSFVTEPVGEAITRNPGLLAHVRAYATNAVRWLGGR
jgi:hypothetical protein